MKITEITIDVIERIAPAVHVQDARTNLGGATTQGAERTGGVARQATVDLGHERGSLLMPGQYKSDLVRRLQRHHEVGVFLAGHAEDVFDAFFLKASH